MHKLIELKKSDEGKWKVIASTVIWTCNGNLMMFRLINENNAAIVCHIGCEAHSS